MKTLAHDLDKDAVAAGEQAIQDFYPWTGFPQASGCVRNIVAAYLNELPGWEVTEADFIACLDLALSDAWIQGAAGLIGTTDEEEAKAEQTKQTVIDMFRKAMKR